MHTTGANAIVRWRALITFITAAGNVEQNSKSENLPHHRPYYQPSKPWNQKAELLPRPLVVRFRPVAEEVLDPREPGSCDIQ